MSTTDQTPGEEKTRGLQEAQSQPEGKKKRNEKKDAERISYQRHRINNEKKKKEIRAEISLNKKASVNEKRNIIVPEMMMTSYDDKIPRK